MPKLIITQTEPHFPQASSHAGKRRNVIGFIRLIICYRRAYGQGEWLAEHLEAQNSEREVVMFYILQLSYCCFTLCYYPLELEIAGKNSKLLPLFCQNPVRLQSFVMDKPEIETITEKSQPGSVLSEQICILNWSHLMREASCKHTHTAEW